MQDLIALIDVGSNAARFVFARLGPGPGFHILAQSRVQTRLGSNGDGLLSQRAMARTSRAAERFLQRVRRKSEPRVLAVATAAVRDAPNRHRLLARMREIEGVKLRVLSGKEEARLGAEAAVRHMPLPEGVVVDLGGGSLQITLVRRGRVGVGKSVPLGTARLTQRFLHHDPPTPGELALLRQTVRTTLAQALPRPTRADAMVVLGGTGRALASGRRRAAKAQPGGPPKKRAAAIGRRKLERLRAKLEPLSLRERRQLPGIDPQRADILVAGAIVLEELMDLLGCTEFTASSASVREGVLWREATSRKQ